MPANSTSRSWLRLLRPAAWAIGLAGLLAAVVWSPSARSQQVDDPAAEEIPRLQDHYDDPSKSMIVRLRFNGPTTAQVESTQVVRGRTRGRIGDPPLLRVDTSDRNGNGIETFNAWNPRWTFVTGEDGTESMRVEASAPGNFVFPFTPNLKSMKVTDISLNQEVITVDLAPAIRAFCEANPGEQECKADLVVQKQDGPDPVPAGETLSYQLKAGNLGPGTAWDAKVTDTLPPGVVFQSASPGCTLVGERTMTCEVGELPPGDSALFDIVVKVDPDRAKAGNGTLVNSASIDSPALLDDHGANSSASETTEVIEVADLSLAKTAPSEPVAAGTLATYTFIVANGGPSSASAVRVVDPLPAGVTYDASSLPCDPAPEGQVTCELGFLPVNETRQFTITGLVDSDVINARGASGSITLDNAGVVQNPAGRDDELEDNLSHAETMVVEVADVSVAKTGPTDPVPAGTPLTYALTATNAGPSTATRVRVVDTLPQGVTLESSSRPCTQEPPGTLTCDLGALRVGETAALTVTGFVDSDLVHARGGTGSVTITNGVRVENLGGPDPDPAHDSATADTLVIEVADLEVTKADVADPVGAGTPLRYTVSVSNAGPSTASRVRVRDTLPPGTGHRSDSAGCTTPEAGTLECQLGAMRLGSSHEVTIDTLVDEDLVCRQGGPVTVENLVVVDNPGATDPKDGNNSDGERTLVVDNTVRGGAFGQEVRGTALGFLLGGLPIRSGPSPSVTAPTSGCGPFDTSRSLVNVDGGGLTTAHGLEARVRGDRSGPDAFVSSSADAARVTTGLGTVSLEGVHSECRSDESGSSGTVRIGRLVVNGVVSLNVTPGPNSRIVIPGVGVLILNEQVRSDHVPTRAGEFGRSALVVNAARLKLDAGVLLTADVVLAQSSCSIDGLNVHR